MDAIAAVVLGGTSMTGAVLLIAVLIDYFKKKRDR